jgi:hypothetical protein
LRDDERVSRYATRSVVVGGDASAGSSEVKVCGAEVGDVYVAVKEGILGGCSSLVGCAVFGEQGWICSWCWNGVNETKVVGGVKRLRVETARPRSVVDPSTAHLTRHWQLDARQLFPQLASMPG